MVYSGTNVIKSTSVVLSEEGTHLSKLVKVKNLFKKNVNSFTDNSKTENNLEDIAIGIVLKTGKRTKRGELLKNIQIRKPVFNAFITQSNSIMGCLLIASFILMVALIIYLSKYIPHLSNLRYSVDLMMAFFSPALYSSLEMGVLHAQNQLFKKKINTIDVKRINTAGEVDMAIFDKTGTLTELGVDILCLDTIDKTIEVGEDLDEIQHLAMSTCHYVMELDGRY